MQVNIEPPPTEWPYDWPHEYPLDKETTCVCDGSGWLELPSGTMIGCVACNHD